MITVLNKWTVVKVSELEETFFQSDAIIEAREKTIAQLREILNNLRFEAIEQNKKLLEVEAQAALVPALQQEVAELQQEVLALQKTTFTELPETGKTSTNKGGRPRKPTQNGATKNAV